MRACDVVVTTCVGSGSEILDEPGLEFRTVVIDECSQATEVSVLVPIVAAARFIHQVVFLGDHHQLPPTVVSKEAASKGLDVSTFARLYLAGLHTNILLVQYRMHPEISKLASRNFYFGKLKANPTAAERKPPKNFPWPSTTEPIAWIDVSNGSEVKERSKSSLKSDEGNEETGTSLWNAQEIECVKWIVETLLSGANSTRAQDIGIISPYSAQVRMLSKTFQMIPGLEVNSVDGFQGREKDVMIVSTVRSNDRKSIGFVQDWRRLNVAMSRARRALIIVGDFKCITESSPIWNQWTTQLKKSKLIMQSHAAPLQL
uniref:DNA2/NAM7 helicase-like C-terminal domain-containing protein n=1 Tax=Timspurckia oligopyrenoides TaxID=708627 RepID=A0A7S1EUF0_9RHOD